MQYSADSHLWPTVEREGLRLDLVTPISTAGTAAVRPEVPVKRQAVSTHRPFGPEKYFGAPPLPPILGNGPLQLGGILRRVL